MHMIHHEGEYHVRDLEHLAEHMYDTTKGVEGIIPEDLKGALKYVVQESCKEILRIEKVLNEEATDVAGGVDGQDVALSDRIEGFHEDLGDALVVHARNDDRAATEKRIANAGRSLNESAINLMRLQIEENTRGPHTRVAERDLLDSVIQHMAMKVVTLSAYEWQMRRDHDDLSRPDDPFSSQTIELAKAHTFKLAKAVRDAIPDIDDRLIDALREKLNLEIDDCAKTAFASRDGTGEGMMENTRGDQLGGDLYTDQTKLAWKLQAEADLLLKGFIEQIEKRVYDEKALQSNVLAEFEKVLLGWFPGGCSIVSSIVHGIGMWVNVVACRTGGVGLMSSVVLHV